MDPRPPSPPPPAARARALSPRATGTGGASAVTLTVVRRVRLLRTCTVVLVAYSILIEFKSDTQL